MTPSARIYPSRVAAEAAAQPGDTVLVLGSTWIVTPTPTAVPHLTTGLTTPGARTSDPATSHHAAARDRTTDRERALAILRQHPAGLTDDALGELMDRRPTSAGKRRLELVERGLVEQTSERRPTRTGSTAIVWRAVAS